MSTFLVTGGAGFIGSNIVHYLLEKGETVHVIDNLSTGRLENLDDVADQIKFFEGSVCDRKILDKSASGADYILHQAAIPSVQRSIDDPMSTDEANITGTLNVLLAGRDAGVKRVVLASSSSVYGESPTLPKSEDMFPEPKSPYALSKLAGEHYSRLFGELFGLSTVCLRYFNVFGPRQDPNSHYSAVIPKFVTSLLTDSQPTIFGDGEQSRDFTFVQNVVQANVKAALAKGDLKGEVINVACHSQITLNKLLELLNKIIGTDIKAIYKETRAGDVRHSFATIDKLKNILDAAPEFDLEAGLEKTIGWYRETTPVKTC
jgi:UDP-N-acetylglucosamine/UDP-N-acetyl-alpha-D-glucosaminouronate 4-epimerase